MILYVMCDLSKGDASPKAGSYVGRVQTGTSDDGSPIYKYFYDAKEYEGYMSRKRQGNTADKREESSDSGGDDEKAAGTSPGKLKQKVAEEHEESKQKQNSAPPGAKSSNKEEKVQKSYYLDLAHRHLYVKE